MYSNSYWDGYYGRPFSGGDQYDYNTGASSRNGSPGHLIGLLLIVPLAVIAASSALVAALILAWYVSWIHSGDSILPFRRGWILCFQTAFLFQVIGFLVGLVIYWSMEKGMNSPFTSLLLPNAQPDGSTSTNWLGLLFQLPSILISAWFFHSKVSSYPKFEGFNGYCNALCE